LRAGQPNALWCADFKGEFLLEDHRYCYPLTITDVASGRVGFVRKSFSSEAGLIPSSRNVARSIRARDRVDSWRNVVPGIGRDTKPAETSTLRSCRSSMALLRPHWAASIESLRTRWLWPQHSAHGCIMWSEPNLEPCLIESLLHVPVKVRIGSSVTATFFTFSEIASTILLTPDRTTHVGFGCAVRGTTAAHIGTPNAPSPAIPRSPVSTLCDVTRGERAQIQW
jgi:hypothetical protein